jgi:hypothetical protein
MNEVEIVLAVLAIGTIIGSLLKPNADQQRPISPDEIRGQAADSHHH